MKFLSLFVVVLVISIVFAHEDRGIHGGCGCDQWGYHCEWPREMCLAKGIPVFGEKYTYDGRYNNDVNMDLNQVDNELKTKLFHAAHSGRMAFNGRIYPVLGRPNVGRLF